MTISSLFIYLFIYFLRKRFHAHKNTSQAKISWRNKNKLTLNNKGNNFLWARKLLGVTCFCACEIFSSKKINRLEIVLITSIYYSTNLKRKQGVCLIFFPNFKVFKVLGEIFAYFQGSSKNPIRPFIPIYKFRKFPNEH